MEYVIILCKVIVSLSLLNVWLIQYKKPTKWRGGDATTIFEEFEVYGLPKVFCYIVGFLKVTLSILLIISIWVPVLENTGAIGLMLLLTGSIIMHIKISDPLFKSFPAFLFLVLSGLIYYF